MADTQLGCYSDVITKCQVGMGGARGGAVQTVRFFKKKWLLGEWMNPVL